MIAAETIDVSDNTTLFLVNEAVSIPTGQTFTDDEPRITLLTDFVSQVVFAYPNICLKSVSHPISELEARTALGP